MQRWGSRLRYYVLWMKALRCLKSSLPHGFQETCIVTQMWSLPTTISCMELSKLNGSQQTHVQQILSLSKHYRLLCLILLLSLKKFCDMLQFFVMLGRIRRYICAQPLMTTFKCSMIQHKSYPWIVQSDSFWAGSPFPYAIPYMNRMSASSDLV